MLILSQPVDQYPQLFAYGNPADVPNMMVVGGVRKDGELWTRSKVDPPNNAQVIKVYAPCVEMNLPDATTGGYRPSFGVEGVSYGRHCYSHPMFPPRCDHENLLTSRNLASGTIAGLGTYFLGLSSLSNNLADNDPVQRVVKLKNQLQTGSCLQRVSDKSICSLYNLADPRTCPPDPPAGFQDGDEVPCKDTSSTSGNTVLAIDGCFLTT